MGTFLHLPDTTTYTYQSTVALLVFWVSHLVHLHCLVNTDKQASHEVITINVYYK